MSTDADAPSVLVVDDDPDFCALVERWLTKEGFRVACCPDAEAFMQALSMTLPDAVCLDLGLPGQSGLELLPLLRRRHRSVPVVILTGERDVETVVSAMRQGAYDYITKPPDRTKLVTTVRNAVERHRMSTRIVQLEREADGRGYGDIIGRSKAMRELFRQLDKIAASDITVLIHGESGTGKELVARAVHDNSARSGGPFVDVNCAAVAETLQESEFFGHEKGAFTGAHQRKAGRFELAHGGSLFLDEIAELSPSLQAKLLRVLQEHRFERVGGTKTVESDFRLVAATHRDLSQMVHQGKFREDLYYRVAVLELEIPPLRDRTGDLLLLVEAFLGQLAQSSETPPVQIDERAMALISSYPWPGNVRELQNVLQRAFVIADNEMILVDDLPPRLLASQDERAERSADHPESAEPTQRQAGPPELGEQPMTLAELERWAIETMMKRTGDNISEVIRRLGIGRTTLYRKLKQYGIR
jgi:two-component system, NtrC family, nitrogen regulation response regulator NtrX